VSRPPAKHVLLDAESVNFIDTTACDELLRLINELHAQGITFAFARVRDQVRDRMRLGGIEAAVGPANFHERVTDGVRAWQAAGDPK
jgi:sulfate permease, SulP family